MRPLGWIVFVFFLIEVIPSSFALDWKKLHQWAEHTTPAQARVAVASSPRSLQALYLLGIVYLNEYNPQEAEKAFRKMVEYDISSVEGRWGVAECLRRKRKIDAAQKVFKEIIASYPYFYPAYLSQSYVYYLKEEFDLSSQFAYHVVKAGERNVDVPNLVRAYCLCAGARGMLYHHGLLLARLRHGRMIMPYLKKAYRLKPDSVLVLFGMGTYYLIAPRMFGGDVKKAEEYLLEAVEVEPRFPDTYVRLAQLYKMKEDEEKFKHYLNKALEIDSQNELALDVKNRTCKFICLEEE